MHFAYLYNQALRVLGCVMPGDAFCLLHRHQYTYNEMSVTVLFRTVAILNHISFSTHNTSQYVVISL